MNISIMLNCIVYIYIAFRHKRNLTFQLSLHLYMKISFKCHVTVSVWWKFLLCKRK